MAVISSPAEPARDPVHSLAGRTVLVTGATGFLGQALLPLMRAAGARIRMLTRGTSPIGCAAGDDARLGDVRHRRTWREVLPDVDVVLHLAAHTDLPAAERNPGLDFAVNVGGMRQMLAASRESRGRPFILFAASEAQCGHADGLPLDGRQPDRPKTFYDLHKLLAEHLLEHAARRGWITATSLRLTSLYGACQGPTTERGILIG